MAHKAFVKPQQSLLFTSITSIDFNREQSQEQIERELHYFYPTSKIVDTVKSLVNSPNGGADKLRKHGLISSTML